MLDKIQYKEEKEINLCPAILITFAYCIKYKSRLIFLSCPNQNVNFNFISRYYIGDLTSDLIKRI